MEPHHQKEAQIRGRRTGSYDEEGKYKGPKGIDPHKLFKTIIF